MFCKPGQSDDNGHDIMNLTITMMVTRQPGQSQMSVCPLWCPLSQWEAEMVANQGFAKTGIISTTKNNCQYSNSNNESLYNCNICDNYQIGSLLLTIIIVTTVIIPAKTI